MIEVQLAIRFTGEPLKRMPVTIILDGEEPRTEVTDRHGVARFDLPPGSGKVLIKDVPYYQGRIDQNLRIEPWSPLDHGIAEGGAPGGAIGGSVAYPGMQTRSLWVDGRELLTDSEGYLVNPEEWSEPFASAQAEREQLALTNEHWEVIRFLRSYFEAHGVQAAVRDIVQHFKKVWGPERGSNRYLHALFPRGGPQKQGNRLAGLLRTKGEH
jgi:tRNA 2-thiouridine synthesizing protein E